MSMTFTNAKNWVARIMGAEGDAVQVLAAEDSIKQAIGEWNLRHNWSYLLMDTSSGFTVAGCSNTGGTVTTTTTDGFAGVNVGQTFTVSDGSPAGTYTVATIVSTSSITVTGGGGNFSTESLVFSADIPVVASTDTYNLPSPFRQAYSARLLVSPRSLTYKEQREIDRGYSNQDTTSTPVFYNCFNKASFSTTRQNGKVRVFPVPGAADTLRVRYFRPIAEPSSGSDILDTLDRYVYALLELARFYFLKDHDAESARLEVTRQRAEEHLVRAIADDQQQSEDRDLVMVPFLEHGTHRMLDSDDVRWDSL